MEQAQMLTDIPHLTISIYVLTVCVPATKLAIQTPRRQPGTEMGALKTELGV